MRLATPRRVVSAGDVPAWRRNGEELAGCRRRALRGVLEPGSPAVPITFRVSRTQLQIAHACQFSAAARPARSRYRPARGLAAAELPQVRARPGEHRRFDLGLARNRAASRTSHPPPRLDVFPARGAPLR